MNKLVLLVGILMFLPFKLMAQFTQQELDIIRSGSEETPFRILKTTDGKDLEILRRKCEDVDMSANSKDLYLLIERLLTTMEAEEGVGIAAPQVGISKNIFLFVRTDEKDYPVDVAINPKIIGHPEETICFERDGCLSVPQTVGNSVRYPWIEIEFTTIYGEKVREKLEGYSREGNFVAVIFQHEFDHLQGILFTDKLCPENK